MSGTGPSPKVRQLVVDRADGMCEVCGRLGEQVHHRKPRRMGGTRDPEINSPSNLLLLCGTCHVQAESSRELALKAGFLVGAQGDPASVPVHLSVGWVFLDGEGRYVA